MSRTPIADKLSNTGCVNHSGFVEVVELERMCNELAEALQWYHGGEPLPTLADTALTKWQSMKAAK